MDIIIGVDPGSKSAAYAILTKTGRFVYTDDAGDLTSPDNVRVFADHLDSYISGVCKASVVLEQVHAFKGQGVTSSFHFGQGYGAIQGVVGAFGLPVTLVRPQVWKKSLGLDSSAERSLELARELYPDAAHHLKRKKDHNRSEALLLAHYGLRAL